MATYEKYLKEKTHPEEIVDLAREILELRKMLWLGHGHKGIYGDDGEMQCGECMTEYGFYDWRREPIEEIKSKIEATNLKRLLERAKGSNKNG